MLDREPDFKIELSSGQTISCWFVGNNIIKYMGDGGIWDKQQGPSEMKIEGETFYYRHKGDDQWRKVNTSGTEGILFLDAYNKYIASLEDIILGEE